MSWETQPYIVIEWKIDVHIWISLLKGRMEDIKLPFSSPTHGPYFGICLEDLLGRDYMPTDPTNARTTSLGQPLFQWRPKNWKTMVYQLAVHSFISFLFCLIQKDCFKHPTFSNDCIFSINFASITKTFYYSKIQYCLNVPPTIMIFVRFNDWFNVIR